MIVGIACGTWDSHSACMTAKNDQKKVWHSSNRMNV